MIKTDFASEQGESLQATKNATNQRASVSTSAFYRRVKSERHDSYGYVPRASYTLHAETSQFQFSSGLHKYF